MRCEFCGEDAEWKLFIAIKRVIAKSRRSYLVTRPSGRQHFVSRHQTTFRNLDGSYAVRIPVFFEEEGTLVCESCSLRDEVLGFKGTPS